MEEIEILQQFLNQVEQVSFQGAYLWKYIIYEMTSEIIVGYQDEKKNGELKKRISDYIPMASPEKMNSVTQLLKDLPKKKILFGLPSIRRLYQGKLEHTACDPYIQALPEDSYVVLENKSGKSDEEIKYVTRNLHLFSPVGVVGVYGEDEVNKDDLIRFLFVNYVLPLEKLYGITFSQDVLLACIQKLSLILKERRAFITFYTEVLQKVRPKVVCYTHGQETFSCFLREAAKELGIPTVEIGHGSVIRNLNYPDNLAYSDYYLSYSDVLTESMRKKGLKNVYTVGKPFVYSHVKDKPIDVNRKIVISVISSLETGLFAKAKKLAEKLEPNKYIVAYKTHPIEVWNNEEMEDISTKVTNLVFIPGCVDMRELCEKTDIIIGVRSSGILDALLYTSIKIVVLRDDYDKELLTGNVSEIFYALYKLGDIINVSDEDELLKEIKTYERGRTYRKKINNYWPVDGQQRFVNFIKKFLDECRPINEEFCER